MSLETIIAISTLLKESSEGEYVFKKLPQSAFHLNYEIHQVDMKKSEN